MKKLVLLFFVFINSLTFSQVGIGTTTPDSSSLLDVEATDKGVLIPRVAIINLNTAAPVVSPTESLLVYNTTLATGVGFHFWDGSKWVPLAGAAAVDNDWTIVGNDMYNANTGNVGVGNTTPTTPFHISGTTVPTSGGSSVTLYANDFSSGTINYITNAGNTCTTSATSWHIEAVSYCTNCTGDKAYISFSSSCAQNQTMIEGNFTPTTTSIDVSFNYSYYDYDTSDSFIVTLYNETTSSVAATLLNLTIDAYNTSYAGTHTVVAGNDYSLRYQYIGDDDIRLVVDDILVVENPPLVTGSYVFRLEDGQQQDGYVLTSDANGHGTWKNGIGTYNFINGITKTSNTVKLGGVLIEDTTIDATNFSLNVSSSGKSNMLYVDDAEDTVKFGHNSTYTEDGNTYTIDGFSTNIEFISSSKKGTSSRGTAVGVGSVEFLSDVELSIASSHSFIPFSNNSLDLGSSNSKWRDIYLLNSPTVTSDMTLKSNVKNLSYGLNAIMQLNTFSYQWKKDFDNETKNANSEKETHLGFSAQELLEVIPEVVKTHSWKALDEATPDVVTKVKNEKLGVRYSEIIPVTVKAIQEQQVQIEELKTIILDLKKQLNSLKTN